VGAVLATLIVPGAAQAAVVDECGQLTGYTAPDPLGPTDGSLQLGLLDPWTVLATATVSPAAAAVLPGMVNTGPTCVRIDVDDDGNISSLDFAPTGTISGPVDFDSGSGFYLFDDRLIVPDFITDANPGLAALFVTSYQAGTTVTVTFTVDTSTGAFTGVDGTAAFCGQGSVTAGGDGQVGDAIIPAAVLDATDIDRLEGAGSRETCATVQTSGTIDSGTGALDLDTDVEIDVAAAGVTVTPPPTSTLAPQPAPSSMPTALAWLIVAAAAGVLVPLFRRPDRRRP
jgi:hypothetical protein